jgi:hypothetical protein
MMRRSPQYKELAAQVAALQVIVDALKLDDERQNEKIVQLEQRDASRRRQSGLL